MYLTVYNDDAEDQNHFNIAASPSGMCTHAYMCCALLQLMDKDPDHQRTYEGSCLVVPHGTQYRTLFPEIVTPHNHWGLLIDPNTGEPYPMASAGNFCFMDPLFPGSPGDSLLFNEDDLNRLKRKISMSPLIGRRNLSPPPQERQTPVSPYQGEHAELLLQRGGITQDQWEELWGFITPGH